jgi:hypothetical protein
VFERKKSGWHDRAFVRDKGEDSRRFGLKRGRGRSGRALPRPHRAALSLRPTRAEDPSDWLISRTSANFADSTTLHRCDVTRKVIHEVTGRRMSHPGQPNWRLWYTYMIRYRHSLLEGIPLRGQMGHLCEKLSNVRFTIPHLVSRSIGFEQWRGKNGRGSRRR